jgi:hypothetical protein
LPIFLDCLPTFRYTNAMMPELGEASAAPPARRFFHIHVVKKKEALMGGKKGARAARLRERVVALVSDPASDLMDDAQLAAKVGVDEETLKALLTEEVVAEAMERRVGEVAAAELIEVDRAMLARAREGHVGAARLLYARVTARAEARGEDEPLPTLEELEEELVRMKG